MSLRTKTLLLTGLSLVALVGVMYLIAVRVLLAGYATAERREVEKRTEEVKQLLSQRMDNLDSQCNDWSSWDDTYAFIKDANSTYQASNLTMSSIAVLKTHLIVLLDRSGRVVYGGWYDFERSTATPLPAFFRAAIAPGSAFLVHPRPNQGRRGLLNSPWGLLMVVSRPVLHSGGDGPSRGTLIFGRLLAGAELDLIQRATSLGVQALPSSPGQLPQNLQPVYSQVTQLGACLSRTEGENVIAGYTVLPDVQGQPAALLRVADNRAIFHQGQRAVRLMLVPALLFGAAFSVIVLLLLERLVLARIAKLSADVATVGASGDLTARVSLPGNDELSDLGAHINNTLEALTRSRVELQESEAQYRDLVETSSDWIWQIDANVVYTYVSPKVRDMLGYEPEEILGKTPFELMPPEEVARLAELFGSIAARREAFVRLEKTCLHADGHPVVMETNGVPIFDSSGTFCGYRGVARDITDRKQAEEALRSRTALLEAQTNATTDGILVVDENQKRVLTNQRLIELFDIPPHILADENDAPLLEHVVRLTKYPEAFVERVRYLYDHPTETSHDDVELKSGVILERYSAPVLGEDARCYGRIWTFRDVTERRQREEALARSRAELQESEEQYRDLTETTSDWIWQTDAQAIYTYASPSVRDTLGYEPEEILGKTPFDLMSTEEAARVAELFGPIAARQEAFTRLENTCLHADGRPVVVETSGVPIFDASGTFGGYRGVDRDITERKQAEEALRQASDDWEGTFDSLTDMVTIHDKDYNIIRANSAARQMLQPLVSDSLTSAKCFKCYHGTEGPPAGCPSCGSLETGKPGLSEIFEPHLNRHLEIRAIPRFDAHHQCVGLVHVVRDITERKQNEEALASSRRQLQESEEQYRDLVETSSDWIWQLDENAVYTYVSPRVRDTLGYEPEEVLGKTPVNLKTPEEAARVGSLFEFSAARREAFVRLENTCLHADGHPVVVETSAVPILDASGTFRGYRGVDRDITDRKQAEAALAAEKERLRVTLRSIGDAVIATDTEGRVSLVSKIAEAMTGWTEAEALGRPVGEVFRVVDEATREPLPSPVEQVLQTRGTALLADHAMLLSRDGAEYLVADSAAPIFDSESRLMGAVLAFRDVTAETHLREEANRAQRLDSVGVLAGGIAHDFNNLLTVIMGGVQMAQMPSLDAERQTRVLKSAQAACARAADLTQKLLTFAKGGAPVKAVSALDAVVRETVEFALAGSSVTLQMSVAPDLWLVEVDAGQISQVVQNLAINAAQAMPAGGRLYVALENRQAGSPQARGGLAGPHVALIVRDEGMGIPPAHLARIFDPYFTTKQQGSGLGLASAHSIVAQHEGHLSVTSQVGVGSTFTVGLPRASAAAATASSGEQSDDLERGSGRILVMDDEEDVRVLATVLLEGLGYEVESTCRGEEAVEAYLRATVQNRPFDLVILDLTVRGGMGGQEAIQRLQEINPQVRAIVCSGYSADQVMRQHREHGFRACVAKPFDIQELARVVKGVLTDRLG